MRKHGGKFLCTPTESRNGAAFPRCKGSTAPQSSDGCGQPGCAQRGFRRVCWALWGVCARMGYGVLHGAGWEGVNPSRSGVGVSIPRVG